MIYDHYYRVKKHHPERYGQVCVIVSRGKRNSVLIMFRDGYRMVTSRYSVRYLEGDAMAKKGAP